MLIVLLQFMGPLSFPPTELVTSYSIPINIVETFQLPYAPDIQDISYNGGNGTLAVRSNAAGNIYIIDTSDFTLVDSVSLPIDYSGFGLAVGENGTFYINSDTSPQILYSDGDGIWDEYVNPAGTQGVGMDCYSSSSPMVTQLNANPSHLLHVFQLSDSTSTSYPFTGVTGEISGYMAHDVMTQSINPPFALVTTTRFGHEFYFHYFNSDEYHLYGQEPTPLPVSESLGLSWETITDHIYWSYIGTDLEYYISVLQIPIFGSIEENQTGYSSASHLQIINNPSATTASLTVNSFLSGQAKVIVYDVYGRRAEVLFNGTLTSGINIFSFTGPPGIYTAVLQQNLGLHSETIRFVLTD